MNEEEGTAPPSNGSAATSHTCEHIQWWRQFRPEAPLCAKRKPPDTEAPSAEAIRASLDTSTTFPLIPPLEMQMCQGRCNDEPVLNWPPWLNELQRTTVDERRRTNADQTAPGSGDPIADEQTPLTQRRWTSRRWLPEPLQVRLRGPSAQSGALSSGSCGH